MRGLWRFIAGLLLVVAIFAGAAVVFRAPLAAALIRTAMAGMGVENPAVSVSRLNFSEIELKDLSGGASARDLAVQRVVVSYDWRTLLAARRVKAVEIGPGEIIIRMAGDGSLSLAGMALPPKGEGGPPPFEALGLEDLAFAVATPEGSARGRLSGKFSPEEGGTFALAAQTDAMGAAETRVEAASLDARLALAPDGAVQFEARADGDIYAPAGAARGVAFAASGEGASWRRAMAGEKGAFEGTAAIDLLSADIPTAEAPSLAALTRPGATGRAINLLTLSGKLAAAFGPDGVSVSAVDGAPLRLIADRGDALAVSAVDGAPLYEATPQAQRAGFRLSLTGEIATGEAQLRAHSVEDGVWTFDIGADFADQVVAGVAFGATAFSMTGEANATRFDGDISFTSLVKRAEMGRLSFADTALRALLAVRTDFAEKSLIVSGDRAKCVFLDRARLAVSEQNSEARLGGASLCQTEGPLLDVGWSGAPRARLAGRLTAQSAFYRIGETRFEGAPPVIDFAAEYEPEAHLTLVDGSAAGGRVIINKALVMSDAAGRFAARLDADGFGGEATLERARIAQVDEAPQVAPVIAAGTGRLDGDRASFDYTASTLKGVKLGAGAGAHDLKTGRGETTFRTGELVFEPGRLQPAGLAPGLTGIIGETIGATSVDVSFVWGAKPEDARSSARIALRDLTFRGPGRAVSKTGGLTGTLALSSLAPLKSDGMQTVKIGVVDLNTLIMENGTVDFELPGDETLHIARGAFPWFGGEIGVYDAVASLAGDKADVPLRADRIDFGQVLAYFNIKGLSGEGVLSGVLPLVIEDGKASIVGGILKSDGPGAIRYVGEAADAAASAGDQAEIAFSILRDLRYTSLSAAINGPLDGRLDIQTRVEGTGEVPLGRRSARVPVKYNIGLDAALLELLNQANLTRDIKLQYERGRAQQE
ncbi:MAG: YdbH domain-containing protein [Pseudomonadota bacterium]|nr:YdbH domain-containing protein [Pseudomonadota bacterium]